MLVTATTLGFILIKSVLTLHLNPLSISLCVGIWAYKQTCFDDAETKLREVIWLIEAIFLFGTKVGARTQSSQTVQDWFLPYISFEEYCRENAYLSKLPHSPFGNVKPCIPLKLTLKDETLAYQPPSVGLEKDTLGFPSQFCYFLLYMFQTLTISKPQLLLPYL